MPEPGSPGAARLPSWAFTFEALPPAVRYQLAGVLAALDAVSSAGAAGAAAGAAPGATFERTAERRLERLIADATPHLGAEGALAELGCWLVDARRAAPLRQLGCAWLALFPSADTARLLGRIALDPATPRPVREQAIAALGARRLGAMHPATRWPADAVQLADEALVKLAGDATAAGKLTSDQLPHALRHVASDGIAAVFARAPGLWGDALECFASPPLARVLAVSIDDIAPQHRLRVLRLIAATLGEEAIPLMLARVPRAAAGEQLEMLLLAVAFGGEVHLGKLEDVLRGKKLVEPVRARARWHLAHRGVVPTVRGLRVARATATVAAAERAQRFAQAADDL
ncbi:MAG TPA: hypothetical protein VFT22_21145, partial [Kofleriaceae bacterium]|nr:hypothetical protein [Kofleriaceae bacterium]